MLIDARKQYEKEPKAFGNKRNNNIADVVIHKGMVYASSGYGAGSILLRPRRGKDRFSRIREATTSHHAS